ncbi:MAG: hypothetical protein ABJQ14_01505 [Hyphomicrobiales bacterium]
MERKVPIKGLNSKDARQNCLGTACYEQDYLNGKFQTFGKAQKYISGAYVGPRSASEKLGRMFGSSKRRDSESTIAINRPKKRLRHEF